MDWQTAVVIGKFYPPHRGHKLLIDTALQQCRYLSVIVCERPTDTIASEQKNREDRAARVANRLLICDTNAWAAAFWHRRYVGRDDERVDAATATARCDLYLLTGDEIPFVQDGFRDGELFRREMHLRFEDALRKQPIPWCLLRGSRNARLASAIAAIDRLFVEHRR